VFTEENTFVGFGCDVVAGKFDDGGCVADEVDVFVAKGFDDGPFPDC
jgi:hypothetical protein